MCGIPQLIKILLTIKNITNRYITWFYTESSDTKTERIEWKMKVVHYISYIVHP
jgi:hypothetical protein